MRMNTKKDAPLGTYFLYADDDPDDQDFFKSMVTEIEPSVDVATVNNGLELLQYLNHVVDKNLPCCIILDINMPIWDGIKTLKALKVDEKYMNIPVVMFTTSRSLRDNELSLMLGAQGFITKPINQHDFHQLYRRFAEVCKDNIVQ
jgi:CheY-like chemotaxis protein